MKGLKELLKEEGSEHRGKWTIEQTPHGYSACHSELGVRFHADTLEHMQEWVQRSVKSLIGTDSQLRLAVTALNKLLNERLQKECGE